MATGSAVAWQDYAPPDYTWQDYNEGSPKPPPAAGGKTPPLLTVGAPPPAGTLPKPIDERSPNEDDPLSQGLTTFGAKMADVPGGIKKLVASKYWPVIDAKNYSELGRDLKAMNPIATNEGSTAMNIGATAANLLPFAPGIAKGINAIPRLGRAGETLDRVAAAAAHEPVYTSGLDRIMDRAQELHEHGGGPIPAPMKAYGQYPVTKLPLAYPEMRDFASNAGNLSARARKATYPMMKGQLANFAEEADRANEGAAERAGVGEPYRQGMNEYRRAMQMRRFGSRAIPTALGGYGAYELYNKLKPKEGQ